MIRPSQLPEFLKLSRIAMRRSGADVAEEAGISRFYLWALENGTATNPSVMVLAGLDAALDYVPGVCALAAYGQILPEEMEKLRARHV